MVLAVSYLALIVGGIALVPGPKKCDESFPQVCTGGDWHPELAVPLLGLATIGFVVVLVLRRRSTSTTAP